MKIKLFFNRYVRFYFVRVLIMFCIIANTEYAFAKKSELKEKTRIILTSDGEIDDECSMVRFLLYSNEWDIEGIITTSSQYNWRGHRYGRDDWDEPYFNAYAEVYPNLIKHDKEYPSPKYLESVRFIGNFATEGEMDSITPGSQHIVKVLLNESDNRPIWIQAWGGTNTIARALKTIEEEHPDKMRYVANKLRFFFLWEQDSTYQSYIRPHWGKYNILTIISDQFWAIGYQWNKILPENKQAFFKADWMKSHILEGRGALCSLYKAHVPGSHGLLGDTAFSVGDFRSEGDSPAFIYTIPTGLRSMESPDYGGWGGRYLKVRENTWLDPVPEPNYTYPEGRWFTETAWGRSYMRKEYPENTDLMNAYFNPITRWADVVQNDFASRADWCVKSYKEANHPPVVKLANALDITAEQGSNIKLSAKGTNDPDGNILTYTWWQYQEVGTYGSRIKIEKTGMQDASFVIPEDAKTGDTIHIICQVSDNGSPMLTRYQRVVITVK